MTTKAIWIEWRKPLTAIEKKQYGSTSYQNANTVRIFINEKLTKSSEQLVRTYWHEMAHTFLHFHRRGKINTKREEALCYRVEGILWELLK